MTSQRKRQPAQAVLSHAVMQRVVCREVMNFFHALRKPEDGWPGLPDQVLIDGLADALFSDAKNRGASQICRGTNARPRTAGPCGSGGTIGLGRRSVGFSR